MILLEREKLLSELEQKIGYSFRSRALLDRALTHRSFANERTEENYQHNEALEFLGDSVLGLVVSAWLLERFPDLSEGKLSKMKAYLVSESSLVELAEAIDLGRYILLNRGEEKTGGRRKRALLADAYEALIGVIYIEGGLEIAQQFLRRELHYKLSSIDPSSMIGADYKSALQERLQATGVPVPEYVVVEARGPDHRRTFLVELRVAGRALSLGEGRTIKFAQQEAARIALEAPDILNTAFAPAYVAVEEVVGEDQDFDQAASLSPEFQGYEPKPAPLDTGAASFALNASPSYGGEDGTVVSIEGDEENEARAASSGDNKFNTKETLG